MIEFKTKYDDASNGVKYVSDSGLPYKYEYEYSVTKDSSGNVVKQLIKTDRTTQVHDRIQQEYPATDINLLMKRFTLGDTQALNIREGMYFDATEMPKNYAEMFDRVVAAEQFFEKLPPDVKEMFSNSPEQFFVEYGSDEFNKKIEVYNDRFKDHRFDIASDSVGDSGEVTIKEY